MILATRNDYEYPSIDWCCKKCEEVYVSRGYPPETRCTSGHGHGWEPQEYALEEYIDLLESLEVGDGVVLCGEGPAPLMGPIEEVGDGYLITESMDSPRRKVRWDRDGLKFEFTNLERDYEIYDDLHHVETVEILSVQPGSDRSEDSDR
ncbi:hypothetical protein ACLI4U_19160 (plasmid) [Natrialbaceae archaeon A-CW2]